MTVVRWRDAVRAYGWSAGGYAALAVLRTALRVTTNPRPVAAAALVLEQSLVLAVPWIVLTPPLLGVAARLGWTPGRRGRILAAHLGLAVALSVLDGIWGWSAVGWIGLPRPASPLLWYLGRLDQALFLYAFIAGIGTARRRQRDLDAVSLRAAALDARLLGARLHVLSLQLQPHFLFNTLNAVSELVHRDAAAAVRLVARLRTLLSRSLAEGAAQEVPLREEAALLQAYADIQRLRFEGSLTVDLTIDQDALDAVVPRLMLQPLVENAIRHGTSRRAAPGRVSVRGWRTGDRLVVEVEDDGLGLPGGPLREGVGLGNTRARLEELYRGDGRLWLAPAAAAGTIARVELPYRRSAVSVSAETGSTDPAPAEAPGLVPRPISRARLGLAIATGWVAAALVGTHEDLAAGWLTHDPESFLALLRPRLGEALLWIPLTAVVLRYAAGLARRGVAGVRLAAAHVAGALVTLGIHLLAVRLWVTPAMDGRYAAGTLLYDLSAYVALASLAHAWTLGRLVAARALDAVEAERDLAAARLASVRWRLEPAFLDRTLAAIGELAGAEPHRADELTGRLGELLRLLLGGAGRDGVSPEAEIELHHLQPEIRRLSDAGVADLATSARVAAAPLLAGSP